MPRFKLKKHKLNKKAIRVGEFFFDRDERPVDSQEDLYSLEFVAIVTLRVKR